MLQLTPELQSLLFGFSSTEEDTQLEQHLEEHQRQQYAHSITDYHSSSVRNHHIGDLNKLFSEHKVYSENALAFMKRKKIDAIQTGIEPFDSIVGEMKLAGSIIELYGNEGQGLTQTCYTSICHLAMPTHFKILQFSGDEKTKPREGYHVLYFDLDDKFDQHRFIEIIEMCIFKAYFDLKKRRGEHINYDDITEENVVEEVFEASESNYKSFIMEILSRIHVFHIDNSFQFALAFEALYKRHLESNKLRDKYILDLEEEDENFLTQRASVEKGDKDALEHLNSYKAIVINSLTQFYKPYNEHDRKNWEKAVELLVHLTHGKQIFTLATVYDPFSKTSRQKYNQKRNTTFYQGANRQFNEDRLASELVQIHRDVLKYPTWTQAVNYRLLFGGDYPDSSLPAGVKYAYLQTLHSGSTASTSHFQTPHGYKDLFKIQILDHGTLFFK
ncbi:hypothetical protein FDP41_003837 [Naegleria fowleri]|uniref:Uncharacterized protein n=1 Tax=Naegleria fowleri TaxID=5763 RepID=A0A6A5BSK8_NAEFO|nr:uncharacterized protein FDP41_003837 [Naegleria fowleri]KAF0977184.1 hypothetical protein FDP41_003837 [Naegleria fowleri]